MTKVDVLPGPRHLWCVTYFTAATGAKVERNVVTSRRDAVMAIWLASKMAGASQPFDVERVEYRGRVDVEAP